MRILITGAKGFVGKNLVAELRNRGYSELYEYDFDTEKKMLDVFCADAEFVFHLAGVNRPKEQSEFMEGNFGFTSELLNTLKKHGNKCSLLISSSIQASADNEYGRSKKAGEDLMLEYEKETGAKVFVYRFPNVFGKWSRPNYNSAVATFCYNVARDMPIQVNDRDALINLVYIDDVVEEFINALNGNANSKNGFCIVPVEYFVKLGDIVDLIYSYKNSREDLFIPDMSDEFTKKLYSTYISSLPEDRFSYLLNSHIDNRGSFTEFIKTINGGQISVNISKPGITKGNHWHHTKNEKFLVVSGRGVIRFRNLNSDNVLEYFVSGDKLEVVDSPVGYTHNIENLGDTDMVTIMWANESFNNEKPDTYYLEV